MVRVYIFIILIFACKKDAKILSDTAYDIIVVMGQSNTQNGYIIDSTIDKQSHGILQLGRHGDNNYKIISATDPLEHWDPRQNRNGFGLPFAKIYQDSLLLKNRAVLLIPCGKGNSGFADNQWNKGDICYNDAVDRIQWVLKNYPNSKLKLILWQQGEKEILLKNPDFKNSLDNFVLNLFKDLEIEKNNFKLIAGGLVPYWVNLNINLRQPYQIIIEELPNRISNTGYANPSFPFVINKANNDFDTIHYSAEGQRELAKRYFQTYTKIK
ncbi:MAG: sialate O-acetylesterase [bacterium]|nr:sialate O-acetylesterase [bacterium]